MGLKSTKQWGVYRPIILLAVAVDANLWPRIPRRRHGDLTGRLPVPGEREPGPARQPDCGLVLHRQRLHPPHVLPRPERVKPADRVCLWGGSQTSLCRTRLSQVPGIHNATGISYADLTSLVMAHEQRTLYIVGDPYVNVLQLNLALVSSYPAVYSSYG